MKEDAKHFVEKAEWSRLTRELCLLFWNELSSKAQTCKSLGLEEPWRVWKRMLCLSMRVAAGLWWGEIFVFNYIYF